MEHIKRQLNINLNKKGLNNVAQASYVCYIFEELKNDLLGNDIFAKAISFKGGVLKLKINNSVAASEVRLRSSLIKEKINQKIGQRAVLRIETKVTA